MCAVKQSHLERPVLSGVLECQEDRVRPRRERQRYDIEGAAPKLRLLALELELAIDPRSKAAVRADQKITVEAMRQLQRSAHERSRPPSTADGELARKVQRTISRGQQAKRNTTCARPDARLYSAELEGCQCRRRQGAGDEPRSKLPIGCGRKQHVSTCGACADEQREQRRS
jgi:hypothetical protein